MRNHFDSGEPGDLGSRLLDVHGRTRSENAVARHRVQRIDASEGYGVYLRTWICFAEESRLQPGRLCACRHKLEPVLWPVNGVLAMDR